jgi:hypothetical protein
LKASSATFISRVRIEAFGLSPVTALHGVGAGGQHALDLGQKVGRDFGVGVDYRERVEILRKQDFKGVFECVALAAPRALFAHDYPRAGRLRPLRGVVVAVIGHHHNTMARVRAGAAFEARDGIGHASLFVVGGYDDRYAGDTTNRRVPLAARGKTACDRQDQQLYGTGQRYEAEGESGGGRECFDHFRSPFNSDPLQYRSRFISDPPF